MSRLQQVKGGTFFETQCIMAIVSSN